jgi:hypothetical protein
MKHFLLLLFLPACSNIPGMPGHVSVFQSKFDQIREIRMEPAWVDNSFKVGLFKNTNMPDSLMIFSAYIKGVVSVNYAAVRVNNKIFVLQKLGDVTSYEHPWSYRRFAFPAALLPEMIDENNEVWVKVGYDDNYSEGKFSRDDPSAARPGFRKFYAKLGDF